MESKNFTTCYINGLEHVEFLVKPTNKSSYSILFNAENGQEYSKKRNNKKTYYSQDSTVWQVNFETEFGKKHQPHTIECISVANSTDKTQINCTKHVALEYTSGNKAIFQDFKSRFVIEEYDHDRKISRYFSCVYDNKNATYKKTGEYVLQGHGENAQVVLQNLEINQTTKTVKYQKQDRNIVLQSINFAFNPFCKENK
jgi:hypothetical protein